jgi:hypothetical protein
VYFGGHATTFQTNCYFHHECRSVKNGYSTLKVDTAVSSKNARKRHSFMPKKAANLRVSTIKVVRGVSCPPSTSTLTHTQCRTNPQFLKLPKYGSI